MAKDKHPFAKLRNRGHRTQQDVADFLGRRQATISAWENQGVVPELTPPQTRELIQYLACTFDELADAFSKQ